MRYITEKFYLVAIAAITVGIVLGGLGFEIYSMSHTETMTCTVVNKDRTTNQEGGSDMRVYTEDCGTLAVGDSLLDGVWNSADVFGKIEGGKTYEFETRGVRVPFLSRFPIITSVKEAN